MSGSRSIWLCIAILLALSTPLRAASHCAIPDVSFASCSKNARHFRSVVIAIPGWNGSCGSTFGQGQGNLLNVMRGRNFFDIDCFDYDSHHATLLASRERLKARLEALHGAGYREFVFITHSTGGVLALDFLLSEALADGDAGLRTGAERRKIFQNQEGTRLRAMFTWAVPLNGVRSQINFGGNILNLGNFSPAVLPLLSANSDYLAQLKGRLRAFDVALEAAGVAEKAAYRFDWVIFQGQSDDWVVRNIDADEPWLPNSIPSRLIATASSHSHNVAAAGTVGAPLYPGEIMADKSALALGLTPRTGTYFSSSTIASQELARQQRRILHGILEFASIRNLFAAAHTSVSEFVIHLLKERFPRDDKFDREAVDGLSDLLETKVQEVKHADAVHFADRLLGDVERGLKAESFGQANRFGGGSFVAARRLAKVLDNVFKTVTVLVRADRSLAVQLATSNGSLETFQERSARLIGRFLAVPDDETQLNAVAALQTVAVEAAPSALMRSGMVEQVTSYSRRKARRLPVASRTQLAQVYDTLARRSPDMMTATLASLTEDVDWLPGQQAPLWSLLLSKDQVENLVAAAPSAPASEKQREFLGQVILRAGVDGKSPDSATKAIKAYEQYLTTAGDAVVEAESFVLQQAIKAAPYPKITIEGNRALGRLGLGEARLR